MTFLLLLLITGLVLVIATVWIALTLLSVAGRGLAGALRFVFDGGRPSAANAPRRCGNDKCFATLSPSARFCGRCGQPAGVPTRAAPPPHLRIADASRPAAVSRVA